MIGAHVCEEEWLDTAPPPPPPTLGWIILAILFILIGVFSYVR